MMREHYGPKCYDSLMEVSIIYTSYSQIDWLIPVLLCVCVCVCVCNLKTIFKNAGTDRGWGEER